MEGYWIGHILRRNCLLQHVIEGKIKGQTEVTGRRGRRCKKLLDDLKDRRGYCQLKEEALDRTMWRNCFGKRLWTCRLTDYGWWLHNKEEAPHPCLHLSMGQPNICHLLHIVGLLTCNGR